MDHIPVVGREKEFCLAGKKLTTVYGDRVSEPVTFLISENPEIRLKQCNLRHFDIIERNDTKEI